MNRRGVLKFLGLSSVAAPALAKSGVDTGLSAGRSFEFPMEYTDIPESIGGLAAKHWEPPVVGDAYEDFRKRVAKGISPLDLAKRIYRAELEKAHYTSEEYRRRRMMEERAYLHRIDPELAAYKSFSAVTLMRMQAERNFERSKEHSSSYWDDVIRTLKRGLVPMSDVDKAFGKPAHDDGPQPQPPRDWP